MIDLSTQVLPQEKEHVIRERMEEVIERYKQHKSRVRFTGDLWIHVDTTAPMYLRERKISDALDDKSQAFRLIRRGTDKWRVPLVPGYTYEFTWGNGPRITAKFIWNEIEEEIEVWPERSLLTRDMISSSMHPKSNVADWVVFDHEGNQVEVKNLLCRSLLLRHTSGRYFSQAIVWKQGYARNLI
jgi:hypothetical protein